ncbi:putative beta-lactamase HcpC [Halichondria panicea]|uniref:putative beta-lactamase HcpC n=1 Tax=Halichondria panicea TaxID=6063 RepID=UPI00312B686B
MLQCTCMCRVNSRSIKLFSRFTSALSSGTAQARRLRLPSAAAKPNTVIAGVFSAIQPAFHSHLLATRQLSYDNVEHDQFIEAVKTELKTGDGYVKDRQLSFLSSITSDVSDVTVQLLKKLNSETNLSGAEVYDLAVAVFQSRDRLTDAGNIATTLFEYSGELGDSNASYTFAQLLRTGQGVSPDVTRAGQIMTELSMKGHPYAQFTLAGMYYSGMGMEQNFNRAFTLYKVSSQNFIPEAYNILGEMYKNGQGVAEDMTEAVACYKKGAELGDPMAHLSLGVCYTHGKGVEESMLKAFEHHTEASKSGHPIALYNLGGHYFAGKGVEQSFEKASESFQQAANIGFAPAQVNLGNMYYNGLGVTKDKAKAKELYKLAADRDKNAKALLEEIEAEEKKEGGNS